MTKKKRIEIPDWLKDELLIRYHREHKGGEKKSEFYQRVVESGLVNLTKLSREELEKRKEEQMEE